MAIHNLISNLPVIKKIRVAVIARQLRKSQLIDIEWYRHRYSEAMRQEQDPVLHYILDGAKKDYWPNPLFDPAWYKSHYQGELPLNVTPLLAYLSIGMKLGHKPNPFFDPVWYLRTYSSAKNSSSNPLVHYLKCGARDGLDPSAEFSGVKYLEANPDVRDASKNPLVHYLHYGLKEGRSRGRRTETNRCTGEVTHGSAGDAPFGEEARLNADFSDFMELRRAISRLTKIFPASKLVDLTYPAHILPLLAPNVSVATSNIFGLDCAAGEIFYDFKQNGGHSPVSFETIMRETSIHEWAYVGSRGNLPADIEHSLHIRSYLFMATLDDLDDFSKWQTNSSAKVLKLSPLLSTNSQLVALTTLSDSEEELRGALTSGYRDIASEALRVIALKPADFICRDGFAETAQGYSWMWCGPGNTLHIALGKLPWKSPIIEVTATAISEEIALSSSKNIKMQINGAEISMDIKAEGKSLNFTWTVDGDEIGSRPLVLSIGCREGVRLPNDTRSLTMHINEIRYRAA